MKFFKLYGTIISLFFNINEACKGTFLLCGLILTKKLRTEFARFPNLRQYFKLKILKAGNSLLFSLKNLCKKKNLFLSCGLTTAEKLCIKLAEIQKFKALYCLAFR